jgi:predicted CXXCH cytochrome family protein
MLQASGVRIGRFAPTLFKRVLKLAQSAATVLALLLSTLPMPALPVEHPGSLHESDDCSPCHVDKTRGKSVHSAMTLSCTICHLASTQGDLTRLNLIMPKEQICFACHEKSAELRQHSPQVNASCVECHDAHSSERPMLLRKAGARRHQSP